MRRGKNPTLKLMERIGPVGYVRRDVRYWSPTQLAVALGCTEQTVKKWERDGQIPQFELYDGRAWVSEKAVEMLEARGVLEIGGYKAITAERAHALRNLGYKVPNSAIMTKKGGSK